MAPTLLVHGIWDTGKKLEALERGLRARGIETVQTLDLVPNDGRASIAELATLVEAAAAALVERHGGPIDLVGFSMGALVSRYFVQRLSGKRLVRRFVSISGPHSGTYAALAMPGAGQGIREMRPESVLLRDLASDVDPFGSVEVHVLYTPYDLMILPASSSRLRGAHKETQVPIAFHRWMITHPRAIGAIADALTGGPATRA